MDKKGFQTILGMICGVGSAAILIVFGLIYINQTHVYPEADLTTGGITAIGDNTVISKGELNLILEHAPDLSKEPRFQKMLKTVGGAVELTPKDQLLIMLYSSQEPEGTMNEMREMGATKLKIKMSGTSISTEILSK